MNRVYLTAILTAGFLSGAGLAAAGTNAIDSITEMDPVGCDLQSAMIWSPSVKPGTQAYVAFRKVFDLPEVKAPAVLHLFADSRYLLWVNGKYVLRGPCRFHPKRPEYDSVDVGSYLRPGSNVIVALVHNYGKEVVNGRIMRHAPGFTARLDVGGREVLRTSAAWRCSTNTEYCASPNAWSSIPDVIDGREWPGEWTGPGFDDAAWKSAVNVDGGTWGALQPRALPLPRETEVAGLKLLPSGQVLAGSLPLDLTVGQETVIDLGRMVMAYAVADLEADAGSVLKIRYALRYENGKPLETYGVGTTYTARGGRQGFMTTDQWCSHYMIVKCESGRIKLHGLRMVDRRYPFERVGRFCSSDPLLDRLWEISVYTIETVTDDGYGSDARERNEWLQDPAMPNFITTQVASSGPGNNGAPVYSDPRLLKNILRHADQMRLADGRIVATFPTDRRGDCHYFIEDYACQWVEALRLYYEATGDRVFVREMWPALTAQMRWFEERMTPRGLLLAREYASFDNPLAYITCEGATLNAYLYQALRDSACLARALDESQQAAAYDRQAAALGVAYNRELWNEAEQGYNAAFLEGKALAPSAHAQLLALDRGIVPDERKAAVRKWFLANYKNPGSFHCGKNPDVEKMIGNKVGINMPVVYYWVFQELYRMDTPEMDQEAVGEMRRRWKVVVDRAQSTGTVTEGFGVHEGCHNYGAVPAYFLSSYVLGVRRDGPVWQKKLRIEPRLADLVSAEGVVVTEFGPVPVSWRRSAAGKRLDFSFTVPKGVKALVRLPMPEAGARLTLNGRDFQRGTFSGRWLVFEVEEGAYEGQLRY